MLKRFGMATVVVLVLVVFVSYSFAWNKPGHMVSAAIAYSELKQASPEALSRVVALLKEHPEFQTRWALEIAKPFVPPEERDRISYTYAHAATLAKGKKGVLLPFISQKYADPFDHPAYFQAYKKSFKAATGFPPTELDRLFMIRLRTSLQTHRSA